ncbi:ribosomal protein L37AE/L43A [Paenibacillus sp. RC254]
MTGKLHKLKVRSHFHHCIFCNSKESIVLYRGIVICAECYLKVTKKPSVVETPKKIGKD